MINNCVLVGRLAADPEMKYTQSGMPITNFRLAVDRGRKNEQGETIDRQGEEIHRLRHPQEIDQPLLATVRPQAQVELAAPERGRVA